MNEEWKDRKAIRKKKICKHDKIQNKAYGRSTDF